MKEIQGLFKVTWSKHRISDQGNILLIAQEDGEDRLAEYILLAPAYPLSLKFRKHCCSAVEVNFLGQFQLEN